MGTLIDRSPAANAEAGELAGKGAQTADVCDFWNDTLERDERDLLSDGDFVNGFVSGVLSVANAE